MVSGCSAASPPPDDVEPRGELAVERLRPPAGPLHSSADADELALGDDDEGDADELETSLGLT
jgi:hypothetical protein